MKPALVVALLWLLFGGSHVGLATRPVRTRLVRALGEGGFLAVFWLVAATTFSLLAHVHATLASEGIGGVALGAVPALRVPLVACVAAGIVLMVTAFAGYVRSPYAAMLAGARRWQPRGVERITRHPFFAGVALFAGAHALLAPRLVSAVFFAGFAVLATLGPWHQDRKLRALHGEPYVDYLRVTSAVPFAAVARGRQTIVWREMPLGHVAIGLGLAWLLRVSHAAIVGHGGAFLIAVVVGGAAVATVRSLHAASRRRERQARIGDDRGNALPSYGGVMPVSRTACLPSEPLVASTEASSAPARR
jgi:uncharacterized membrane protein